MAVVSRRKLGGGAILVGAGLLGRETISWAIGRALDLFTDKAGHLSLAAFPWQNFAALSLALIGFAMVFWPSKKTAPEPDKIPHLVKRCGAVVQRIRRLRGRQGWLWVDRDPLEDVVRDGISLLMDLEKLGYDIPSVTEFDRYERMAVTLETYLAAVFPLLRDRHISEAKQIATGLAQNAMAEGRELRV